VNVFAADHRVTFSVNQSTWHIYVQYSGLDQSSGVARGGRPARQSPKGGRMGVKFNKFEFIKLLSHMLNSNLLIFVFKEMGALST